MSGRYEQSAAPVVALPCLERRGPHVDAIRPMLTRAGGEERDRRAPAVFSLDWRDERLTLLDLVQPRNQPLWVDWVTPLSRLRSYPASRKESLGRAMGRKSRRVVDATAGWGHDGLRLLAMGYRVHLLERSPVVAALLSDGLRRLGKASGLVSKLCAMPTMTCCDAVSALPSMSVDCVYLDPMFPPRSKTSVLSKRPLRVLGEFAADAPAFEELFAAARAGPARRIVVKRPDRLRQSAPTPDQSFEGKLVRYDLYLAASE